METTVYRLETLVAHGYLDHPLMPEPTDVPATSAAE